MKLLRRQLLHLVAGAAALPAVSRFALALDYPTRPIHAIVGYPPGSGPDIEARLIGQWLSERLGQPFIVENRPGAASNLATEAVVHAPPPTATRSSWSRPRTRAMPHFTTSSVSISSATSRRSPDGRSHERTGAGRISASSPRQSSTSSPVSCARWRLPRPHVRRCCPTSQRSASSCLAMRRAPGSVSARPGTRPPRSSRNSTRISMPASPILN